MHSNDKTQTRPTSKQTSDRIVFTLLWRVWVNRKRMGCDHWNWIELAHDRVSWRILTSVEFPCTLPQCSVAWNRNAERKARVGILWTERWVAARAVCERTTLGRGFESRSGRGYAIVLVGCTLRYPRPPVIYIRYIYYLLYIYYTSHLKPGVGGRGCSRRCDCHLKGRRALLPDRRTGQGEWACPQLRARSFSRRAQWLLMADPQPAVVRDWKSKVGLWLRTPSNCYASEYFESRINHEHESAAVAETPYCRIC
jgi:hypothetical protein